jgi:(1->4)-alpha-D-glucan 1-alpha-D-glucosylmutase
VENCRLAVAVIEPPVQDRCERRQRAGSNEEYFIYQVLVGTWPFETTAEGEFGERLKKLLTKALREAKVRTSWLTPDEDYERAVLSFVDALLRRAARSSNASGPFSDASPKSAWSTAWRSS